MKKILNISGAICALTLAVAISQFAFAEEAEASVQIIPRDQWGANESYRYLKDNDKKSDAIDLDDEYYEKFKDELQYSRVIETDEEGEEYKWPLQYPEKVVKFIIHHSATTKDLDNPAQAIRNIYHHHAVNRGWGDIGYNYIIDPMGRIYEGRYGGEGVIGAHSSRANHGSIGIMALGNYQNDPVPEAVINSISGLIHEKSKIHGITPDGSSLFRGNIIPNVLGHRDVGSTSCPGNFLYEKLPIIRTLAAESFEEKPRFVKDYDFQNRSDVYYVELKPEESREITIRLENIGTKDWGSGTYLVVNTNPDFDGVINFPGKDGANLAMMEESLVKSGDTATFRFTIQAEDRGRTVQMHMTPMIDGTRKLTEYVVLPVAVQQAFYSYEKVGGTFPPSQMEADTSFSATLRLRNKGNTSWHKEGERAVTLNSPGGGLVATMSENTVRPGEIGTFNFTVRTPLQGGTYRQVLVPDVKNASFNSSPEISFETRVYGRDYDAEVLSRTVMRDMEKGNAYTLSMTMRNVGSRDWNRSGLELFVLRNNDVGLGNLNMQPSTVRPGETAEISFVIQINDNAELGNKILTARAMISGEPLNLIPATFRYSVVEKKEKTASVDGPDIRIKLSFEGEPEVTSSGVFDVYSGEKHIRTASAGEKVKVTREGGSYRVSVGTSNFTESSPIRFVPTGSGITQISNYENRPAWNQSLNDNEFRGAIEVREENGKLIAINELPLEHYLRGLGEVPNAEETEKIKAVMTSARTYAKHYMVDDEKFPGKPYHLDDDPNVTQKYIGFGFEKRAPNVTAGVNATKGVVITYDGDLIKTPYFNQSDGVSTKSAEEVWGWTNTPYLISVDDSYCEGDRFLGHGVGLSGCGSHGMAKGGYSYEQILKHYYTGIELKKLW